MLIVIFVGWFCNYDNITFVLSLICSFVLENEGDEEKRQQRQRRNTENKKYRDEEIEKNNEWRSERGW